jgi:hypothetical protein
VLAAAGVGGEMELISGSLALEAELPFVKSYLLMSKVSPASDAPGRTDG